MSDTKTLLHSFDYPHCSQRTSMTSTQETRPVQPVSENVTGPGSQLRRARENNRLSVEAVAAQLHILPKVIVALEADDFAHLPSPVFVRGYLRSYARIVNLSADPLLEIFNRTTTGAETAQIAPPTMDEGNDDRQIRWGVYLGVLAVLVSSILWVNRDGLVRFWAGSGSTVDEVASTADTPPASALNHSASESRPPELSVTEKSPMPAAPRPAAAADSAPGTLPQAALAKPTPAGSPAAARTNPPAESAATVAAQEIGQGPDTLTVRLSADSWVAIRDASGQRLVYGTLAAGTVRSVRGQAPFALVLGNSTAAQVEFNGQTVEHSKYTVGAVARFKLTK